MNRPESRAATYLYCLVQRRTPPSLRGVPPGLPHLGRPRLLDAGGSLWLVAADAPLSRYGAVPIERGLGDLDWVSACAVAHERVVEHFASAGKTLPMKLFTLFRTDGRAIHHVAQRRGKILRVLERVGGRLEWGLRVRLDPVRALRRARAPRIREGVRLGTGARFLAGKQRERDAARHLATEARAQAGRIFRQVARQAEDARRRPLPADQTGAPVLLDAAFLLPPKRAPRFRRFVKGMAARFAPKGYDVTLTGPWPPYNFLSERA